MQLTLWSRNKRDTFLAGRKKIKNCGCQVIFLAQGQNAKEKSRAKRDDGMSTAVQNGEKPNYCLKARETIFNWTLWRLKALLYHPLLSSVTYNGNNRKYLKKIQTTRKMWNLSSMKETERTLVKHRREMYSVKGQMETAKIATFQNACSTKVPLSFFVHHRIDLLNGPGGVQGGTLTKVATASSICLAHYDTVFLTAWIFKRCRGGKRNESSFPEVLFPYLTSSLSFEIIGSRKE